MDFQKIMNELKQNSESAAANTEKYAELQSRASMVNAIANYCKVCDDANKKAHVLEIAYKLICNDV